MKWQNKNTGFTLIELSIVLVIISLIIGGIIGGKSLIHSSKLHAQISQLHEFEVAYNNFVLQYDAIPGDFSEATNYWPNGNTSNGDGDRLLERGGSAMNVESGNYSTEIRRFFQHLSLAELVKETFDSSSVLGQGYPAMAINNAYGMIGGMENTYESGRCSALGVKLYMQIVLPNSMPDLNGADNGYIFYPRDAKALDKKMDDGQPYSGKYCSWNGGSTSCLTGGGQYQVSRNSEGCRSSYRL